MSELDVRSGQVSGSEQRLSVSSYADNRPQDGVAFTLHNGRGLASHIQRRGKTNTAAPFCRYVAKVTSVLTAALASTITTTQDNRLVPITPLKGCQTMNGVE